MQRKKEYQTFNGAYMSKSKLQTKYCECLNWNASSKENQNAQYRQSSWINTHKERREKKINTTQDRTFNIRSHIMFIFFIRFVHSLCGISWCFIWYGLLLHFLSCLYHRSLNSTVFDASYIFLISLAHNHQWYTNSIQSLRLWKGH